MAQSRSPQRIRIVHVIALIDSSCAAAGRGGRKLEDVSAKYQNACRKLHLTHNEYVLLLSEASEFERDFRTVLLPGLLERQQALQEGFISSWYVVIGKTILLAAETFSRMRNDGWQVGSMSVFVASITISHWEHTEAS